MIISTSQSYNKHGCKRRKNKDLSNKSASTWIPCCLYVKDHFFFATIIGFKKIHSTSKHFGCDLLHGCGYSFCCQEKTKNNVNLGGDFHLEIIQNYTLKTCKFKASWEEIHHNQICPVNFLDLLKVVGKNDKTYSPNGGEQW